MHKLLSANISRLLLNKGFWLSVVLMMCSLSFFSWLMLSQGSTRMDIPLYITIQGIGILTSVFISVFYGTEYNDGTLRNKVIVGHKRDHIYLASFLTGTFAISIIYLVYLLLGTTFIIASHTTMGVSGIQLFLMSIVGWLACVSYIAIFNFVGMLSSSKARTSIINILTAFMLMFVGLTCYSIARPGQLADANRAIFQFLFDINPFGQTFQFISYDIAYLYRLMFYAILLILILSELGMYIFRKKDIK